MKNPSTSNGFVSLTFIGENEKINVSRVSLQEAASKDRKTGWGGCDCDDGCENGG